MAKHRRDELITTLFLEPNPASRHAARTCAVVAEPATTGSVDAIHCARRPNACNRARVDSPSLRAPISPPLRTGMAEFASLRSITKTATTGLNLVIAPHPRQPLPGAHRKQDSNAPHRIRAVSVALAAGAVLAGSSWTVPVSSAATASVSTKDGATNHGTQAGPSVLAVSRDGVNGANEAITQLSKGTRMASGRAERAADARRPLTVSPTTGTITSRFGARWGTNHDGVDIANTIGTPVFAVTSGVVLQSGPASGFGLWVRVRQDDGTIGVYGHINESFVAAGQVVLAGQKIATIGNRGVSTGPHLHYGVLTTSGAALDPLPWLGDRGVSIP